jgi:cellulose synthase/poly-beta-1,6-N-acetylglucosamine synthase-like glycosyltransferase
MSVAETVLVVCAALILYHHLGYPFILRALGSRRPPETGRPSAAADGSELSVTLLIPAHNEQRVIGSKIANCAELDYPPAKLKVVVALDGCSDDTEAELQGAARRSPGLAVRTIVFPHNIGKIAVLNHVIPEIDTDLVALSDASAILSPDTVRRAVSYFSDLQVGVVCGTYLMPEDASPGERAYWDYQARIKLYEARTAAPMGAHGAFYLFRRSLWTPLEPDTINDDFVLPMRIVMARRKAIYDPMIVARELEAADPRQDFRRRIRIGAGNLQQALRLWRLADPRRPGLAFVFVSGKGLRAMMPFVLLAMLMATASLALTGDAAWKMLLGAGLGIGFLSLAAAAEPGRLPRIVDQLAYAAQGYVASGLGALLLLTGHARAAWRVSKVGKKAQRAPSGDRKVVEFSDTPLRRRNR